MLRSDDDITQVGKDANFDGEMGKGELVDGELVKGESGPCPILRRKSLVRLSYCHK